MTFFEDIGEQFAHLLTAFISAIIVYFAWKSTYVREERFQPSTVLIIENSRRRFVEPSSSENVRSSSSLSNYSNATEEADIELERNPSPDHIPISHNQSLQAFINEVNIASSDNNANQIVNLETIEQELDGLLDDIDTGPQNIIAAMENPDRGETLRRRRIAFYEGARNTDIQSEGNTETQPTVNRRENLNLQAGDQTDNSHADNCSNENNENENISKIESKPTAIGDGGPSNVNEVKPDEFRIKLKYLNDDLRLVKGSPNEAIGDFKKRNFTSEISTGKLVRLVFNGHVLQPDSKTLQACGLFDNCVVHCLIHNKRPTAANESSGGAFTNADERNNEQSTLGGGSSFSDRSRGGVIFVYLGMTFISLAMIFCWYCRFQYGYLFSWYSTTGLVLMTTIFLIIFPLIILIERGTTT